MARKSNKRPQSITAPPERPRARRIAFGTAMLRIVLVALLAAGFAVYGLIRHFTHPYRSMLAPSASAEDTDSVEIPAPEIQPVGDP